MHILLIICASEMLTHLSSCSLNDRTFSATALRVCFWFFNTISAIIFSWFLPTNKPILLISCHALTFYNVLSSSTVLSDTAITAASCSLTCKCTCGHCAGNTWSTVTVCALSSVTFLLVFTCCGMMPFLLADEAGLRCLKITILFLCLSQCLF